MLFKARGVIAMGNILKRGEMERYFWPNIVRIIKSGKVKQIRIPAPQAKKHINRLFLNVEEGSFSLICSSDTLGNITMESAMATDNKALPITARTE
ncbi:unnamed protein product [marine sediment metagenome]|uniref:Uncharacterized protein n=1 Tax=marine sediment metagenome TaxID=412755 RepID=X1CV29_9ZZZZ